MTNLNSNIYGTGFHGRSSNNTDTTENSTKTQVKEEAQETLNYWKDFSQLYCSYFGQPELFTFKGGNCFLIL